MCADFTPPDCDRVEPLVLDIGDYRSLYFTLDQVQSRMDTRQPNRLELDYTRTMMGFLMRQPCPASIAMIGLGGGSLLKFCYHHLPRSHLTVVEINPEVIALRHQFQVPHDSVRIRLLCADGADFVAQATTRFDVLLVDGFDRNGQAPSLCTESFYRNCYQLLSPDGILVCNLHHDDPDHAVFTARMVRAFGTNVFEAASQEKSNSIVFACKGAPMTLDTWRSADPLQHFGPEVRAQLRQEFARITWGMTQPGWRAD